MKAIHAENAVLWQPGEQRTDKQTDRLTDYYTRGRPRASGNKQTDRLLYPWPPTRASGNYKAEALSIRNKFYKASINYSRERSCVRYVVSIVAYQDYQDRCMYM